MCGGKGWCGAGYSHGCTVSLHRLLIRKTPTTTQWRHQTTPWLGDQNSHQEGRADRRHVPRSDARRRHDTESAPAGDVEAGADHRDPSDKPYMRTLPSRKGVGTIQQKVSVIKIKENLKKCSRLKKTRKT